MSFFIAFKARFSLLRGDALRGRKLKQCELGFRTLNVKKRVWFKVGERRREKIIRQRYNTHEVRSASKRAERERKKERKKKKKKEKMVLTTSFFYGTTLSGAAAAETAVETTTPTGTTLMMRRNGDEDNNNGKKKTKKTTKDVERGGRFSGSSFNTASGAKKKLAMIVLFFGFLSAAVASVSASLTEEGVSIPDVRLDQQQREEEEEKDGRVKTSGFRRLLEEDEVAEARPLRVQVGGQRFDRVVYPPKIRAARGR